MEVLLLQLQQHYTAMIFCIQQHTGIIINLKKKNLFGFLFWGHKTLILSQVGEPSYLHVLWNAVKIRL